jgi:hypothetical protein
VLMRLPLPLRHVPRSSESTTSPCAGTTATPPFLSTPKPADASTSCPTGPPTPSTRPSRRGGRRPRRLRRIRRGDPSGPARRGPGHRPVAPVAQPRRRRDHGTDANAAAGCGMLGLTLPQGERSR